MHCLKNIIFALLLSAPTAQPSPLVDSGHAIVDSRWGLGSLKPRVEPQSLFAKREDNETRITYGKTKIDYGCDASVHYTFKGLEELCSKGAGACDEGTTWSRKVRWTGGSTGPELTDIKIKAEGQWAEDFERDYLIEAIMKTARTESPATIDFVDRKYIFLTPGSIQPLNGKCKMTQFPNFIAVQRYKGGVLMSEMKITVSLGDGEDAACQKFKDAAAAVAGALSGIAGGYFGLVTEPVCKLVTGSF